MSVIWTWGAEEKKKGKDGFNNAGILTFNSHAINSFVRELFQNSNDARSEDKGMIRIRIEYRSIPKSEIPAFDQFVEVLSLVEQAHPKHTKFYSKAKNSLRGNTIPFLIYSDFNTKGLTGTEADDEGTFGALVLSEGISEKESKGAGGSFGIGKNAIYGISNLRTVIYSSLNKNGEHIFQGVAKLASYKKNGVKREGRIYLGDGSEILSVRTKSDIPSIFRREEQGLSQFVMGAELTSDWVDEFTRAILRNYWLLLLQGQLVVELVNEGRVEVTLDSKNVPVLLPTAGALETDETIQPYGDPNLFYEAYTRGNKESFDVPYIGRCTFHFLEIDEGENNVAYIRNGMVVYSRIEKRLVGASTIGVFKCEEDAGNEILRLMEPPKHDSFEPEMLEKSHDLGKKGGEKILASIKSNIRRIISQLIEKYKQEVETPQFLVDLFEDLQQNFTFGAKGERANVSTSTETLYRRAKDDLISVKLSSDAENQYISASEGKYEKRGGGQAPGTAPGEKKTKKKGGTGHKGGTSKNQKTQKNIIRSRIFFLKRVNGRNTYKAVLESASPVTNAEIGLLQYGDSGEEVAFDLVSVKDASGKKIPIEAIKDDDGFVSEFKIRNLTFTDRMILFLDIHDNQRSAFVINS
jgi:hypothetical protein